MYSRETRGGLRRRPKSEIMHGTMGASRILSRYFGSPFGRQATDSPREGEVCGSPSSGDQHIFGSRRKQKFKPTVIPPYADSLLFILCKMNSCYRARLFPSVLDVITDLWSFTSCVRHSHLRLPTRFVRVNINISCQIVRAAVPLHFIYLTSCAGVSFALGNSSSRVSA